MNDREPTVYVVDDDPPVLRAISRLLRVGGFHVMAFASPRRFLEQYQRGSPGCLVLDLTMPDLNGLELQEELAAGGDSLPIIFLTGNANVPASVKAMKQGAVDFLTKPVERKTLMEGVRAALAKDRVARQARAQVNEIRGRIATLTPREYEVFESVVSGKLNKQTATDLGTAEKTIKVHRARVMEKMRVNSLAQLVRLAERAGIAPAETDAR